MGLRPRYAEQVNGVDSAAQSSLDFAWSVRHPRLLLFFAPLTLFPLVFRP